MKMMRMNNRIRHFMGLCLIFKVVTHTVSLFQHIPYHKCNFSSSRWEMRESRGKVLENRSVGAKESKLASQCICLKYSHSYSYNLSHCSKLVISKCHRLI